MRRNSMPTHTHCWRRLNKLTHSSTLFSSAFSVSSYPSFSFSSSALYSLPHLFFSAFILPLTLLPLLVPLLLPLLQSRCEAEEVFKNISETLQQHNMMGTHSKHTPAANNPDRTTRINKHCVCVCVETGHPAKDGGKSLSADLLQLLKTTLSSFQDRLEAADCQVPTTLT